VTTAAISAPATARRPARRRNRPTPGASAQPAGSRASTLANAGELTPLARGLRGDHTSAAVSYRVVVRAPTRDQQNLIDQIFSVEIHNHPSLSRRN
jgi:hypothetical protein